MEKGKFGISVNVIAVIAFAFVILRQPQSVLLVAGFALLAEKNEWLNKQVMQSLFLTITYYLLVLVSDWVFGGAARFFNSKDIYEAGGVMLKINSFITGVLFLALIVFCLIAILKVFKGQDAGLPCFSKILDPAVPATYAQPVAVAPTLQPKVETMSKKRACPTCSATLDGDAMFCMECGTKIETNI